jgi:hypothetical protein
MPDLVAEVGRQRLQRVARVLDGVVQEGSHQRGGVHAELGEDIRDGQRMGDVRVTGAAQLRRVPLLRHFVGALQDRQVRLRIDLPVHRDERLEHGVECAALGGHPAGEAGTHTS